MRKRHPRNTGTGYWQQREWRRRSLFFRLRRQMRVVVLGLLIGCLAGIVSLYHDRQSADLTPEDLSRLWERFKPAPEAEPAVAPPPGGWFDNRPADSGRPEVLEPPKGWEEHYRRPAGDGRPAYLGPPRRADDGKSGSGPFAVCSTGKRVNCVVDGDTRWLEGSEIRIADIDTPELFSPNCPHEEELAQRAKYRLVELLNEGPFEVVFNGGRDFDKYGRKLRTIMRNGQSIGTRLVSEGLAHASTGSQQPWC